MHRARVIACVGSALVLAGCGGTSFTGWKNLQSVTVTVARPGLPPPGGLPHTTAFTSQAELARVTAALNALQIRKVSTASSTSGCAGGTQIAITITRAHGAPTHLSAYQCGGKTTGDIGGDLSGFLSEVGVSTGA